MFLSNNLINKIFSYESIYHDSYRKCLNELNNIINKYNIILITYNNTADEQKLLFKKFNPIFVNFYIHLLITINNTEKITPLNNKEGIGES